MKISVLCKWVAVAVTLFLLTLWHPRFASAEEIPAPTVLAFAKKYPEIFSDGRIIEACAPVPTILVRQLYENTSYRVLYFTQMILELLNRFEVDVVRIELSENEICIYYTPHASKYSALSSPPHS